MYTFLYKSKYTVADKIPYGMKYWRELYLVDSLFLLFFPEFWQILVWRTDLKWKFIHKHMHAYASIIAVEFILAEFMLAVSSCIRQSAKFNSQPIFHAIW